jgi:L-ascorbate metabolism protein UlaG (beta-lactamase superfamily)
MVTVKFPRHSCFVISTPRAKILIDPFQTLQATAVMVNDHSAFRVDWMPFGGRMESGLAMGKFPEVWKI